MVTPNRQSHIVALPNGNTERHGIWCVLSPIVCREVQSRGVTGLTTSTLASADIELVNVTGSHRWGGCDASGVGDQTLEEKEKLSTKRCPFISAPREAGLFGQTTGWIPRLLVYSRYEHRSGQGS